jgi:undecaprenyl-diphosphatase
MLAYVISVEFTQSRSVRPWVVGAGAAMVLAVGLSRLYLGVHYFSDVLGGFAAGGLWLSACISGLEVARRLKKPGVAPPGP